MTVAPALTAAEHAAITARYHECDGCENRRSEGWCDLHDWICNRGCSDYRKHPTDADYPHELDGSTPPPHGGSDRAGSRPLAAQPKRRP